MSDHDALYAPSGTPLAPPCAELSIIDAADDSTFLQHPVDDAVALVNTNFAPSSDTPSSSQQHHPDQHWDGRRVTLSSWYAEFETTLSYISPTLYEFAVNGMVYNNTIAIIFTEGQ